MTDLPDFSSPSWQMLWREIQRQTGLPADAEAEIIDTVCSLNICADNIKNNDLEPPSTSAENELKSLINKIDELDASISRLSNTSYRAVRGAELNKSRHYLHFMRESAEYGISQLSCQRRKDTALQRERDLLRTFIINLNTTLGRKGCLALTQKKLEPASGKNKGVELTSRNQWVYDLWGLVCSPSDKADKYKWRIESVIRAVAASVSNRP